MLGGIRDKTLIRFVYNSTACVETGQTKTRRWHDSQMLEFVQDVRVCVQASNTNESTYRMAQKWHVFVCRITSKLHHC